MLVGRKRTYYRHQAARSRKRKYAKYGGGFRSFNDRVKGLINGMQEKKFIDTFIGDATPVGATSVITLLSGVAQGDDVGERTGDEIRILNCGFNATMATDLNSKSDSVLRLIIFRAMKNVDGTLPAVTEVLVADCVRSFYNQDNRGDFQILYDHLFVIRAPNIVTADSAIATTVKQWATTFSTPGKKCSFDLSTNVIGAAEKGHLFMIRMTDRAATFTPAWDIDIRCLYVD